MSTRNRFMLCKAALPVGLLMAAAACSGESDTTIGDTPGPMPEEEVGVVQSALEDPDYLITPEFIKPPIIPPELQKVFDIGKDVFPIVSGAISFLFGGPSAAERIDAARATIMAELEAQQLTELKAEITDELNWVGIIARNPCNATSLTNYSLYLSKISGTFEHLRAVVEGPNLAQSQRLVVEMNALGQIYLMMLKGSPEIGSPACGGTMVNGIAPFDQITFNTIYREMKQTNYNLMGAQVAYLATGNTFFPAGTGPFTTMQKSKYYASSLFERKNILDLQCWLPNRTNTARWSCYPSEGTCYCKNYAGQRFDGLGRYECADADEPACLAQITKLIDDRFNADPLINTLRAQQEQLIGAYPDAITDNFINTTVLPAVPIPEFREVPVTAVANPSNSGFDVFYRSSTQSLVHVFNAVGSGVYSVETIGTNIAGTPAAQVTPTTIEVYAKTTGSKICHTRGPRNMNPFGPQWNKTCSDPGLKIFDSPATAPETIVTDEPRTVFANTYGSRIIGISSGPGAPATPSWPLPLPAPTSTAFSRKTPVALGLGFLVPRGSPIDLLFTIGLDGTAHLDQWSPQTNSGYEMGRVDRSQVIGAPSVVSWGSGRWDLFAAGRDKAVWHLAFDSNRPEGYVPYSSLGGVVIAKPAAVHAFPNRLDVFAIGTNGGLFQAFCNGTGCSGEGPGLGAGTFSGWWHLGPTPNGIIGSPVVVSPAEGKLAIVVVDASGALYHKDFNGVQWVPNSGFNPLSNLPVALN